MTAQSGLGFSGIAAIQIPDQGATDFVLTKLSPDNYDYDWLAGGGGGGQVDSVVGGVNITVDAGDPVNPIVNLDAAITGVSVNGVTLSNAGVATDFLDETGAYSVPAGTGITVEEEGVPLATQATTLDFVGDFVTASGVGSTKTITVDDQVNVMFTLTGFFGTILNLFQTSGPSPISIDLAAALGLSSLQTLYTVLPAVPQITVQNGLPMTFDLTDPLNDVFACRDAANVDIVRVNDIDIELNKSIHTLYSTFDPPNSQFVNVWDPTVAITANYIGGMLSVGYDFTVTTGVYIPATFSDGSIARMGASPVFSAYTFINVLNNIQNFGNFNLPSALVMNVGLTLQRNSVGTSTSPNLIGISFQAQLRASVSAAIMTLSAMTAVSCSPTFSTVAGATINFGEITGLKCVQPIPGFFQPSAGTENMTSYVGVDFADFTFGGASAVVEVIRSALDAGTNKRFLNNLGSAESDFGTGHVHLDDNIFIKLGGTNALFDAGILWDTATTSLSFTGGRTRVVGAITYPPITPAALAAGNNNDWDGLGLDAFDLTVRHWARISGNATTSVITGIDATDAEDGDSFELTNVSANAIEIAHQDVASLAANRIISPTGVTYVLAANETVRIRYDTTTARWRLLGGTGA